MDSVSIKREPLFAIGVASIRLGLSLSTLRMYEEEGLLLPYKTPTGRRIYSLADLDWVDCIRSTIKERGLNLEGIREILALIPCWDIYGCSKKARDECEAYRASLKPCWYILKKACSRGIEDCRACDVYLKAPLWLKDPKGFLRNIIETKVVIRKEE
jgi:MerR family transcriptional regulator/heat shock protein HspR